METPAQLPDAKPRYAFVDLAKGFCIMLVVWHHIASTWGIESYPLKETVSLFRMPLYFFLSGLFFKEYAGFFDFCRRKVNKLLIPFSFFFVTLCCLLPFILHYFHLRANPGASVWYSKKLLAKKFPKHTTASLIVLSVALGLAGFFLGRNNIKFPMFLASSLTAIPYFCAGHVAFRYTKILAPNRMDRWNIPLAILLFGITFALSFNAPPESVSYVSNRYWFPIWNIYLCGLLGTLAVLLLSKAIGKIPLVSYFGRYSIMILVTHGWVQWSIIKIFRDFHINWPRSASLATVFVITMLLYLGIIPFMKRFMPHVTAQKDVF